MAGHQTRSKTRSGGGNTQGRQHEQEEADFRFQQQDEARQQWERGQTCKKKGQDADAVPAKTLQEILAAEMPGASASKIAALARKLHVEKKDTAAKQRQDCTCIIILSGTH